MIKQKRGMNMWIWILIILIIVAIGIGIWFWLSKGSLPIPAGNSIPLPPALPSE